MKWKRNWFNLLSPLSINQKICKNRKHEWSEMLSKQALPNIGVQRELIVKTQVLSSQAYQDWHSLIQVPKQGHISFSWKPDQVFWEVIYITKTIPRIWNIVLSYKFSAPSLPVLLYKRKKTIAGLPIHLEILHMFNADWFRMWAHKKPHFKPSLQTSEGVNP